MRLDGTLLGFDVGGSNVRLAVATLGAPPRPAGGRPLPESYADLLDTLVRLSEEAGVGGEVAAVGIGLPGVAHDRSVEWVPNIPYLAGGPFAADVERRLGGEVFLGNDAQLALLGEARFGAARDVASAALVSIGTGIGGALLIGDRIYRGGRGAAGAFGWLAAGREVAPDPERGPLERLASGRALERLGASLTPPRTAEETVAAAARGEADAAEVVERLARDLGLGLASIASVLDPELILVSGGVSDAFAALRAAALDEVARYASPAGRRVPIRVGDLGARAGAFGAVALASEREGAFIS